MALYPKGKKEKEEEKMTNGTIFNPTTLASQVYTIAGSGISLSLLAGMARGIQDITWQQPTRHRKRQTRKKQYNPYQYQSKYTWR